MNWNNIKLKHAKQIFILQSETGRTDAEMYREIGRILNLNSLQSDKAKSEIDELLDSDMNEELNQFTFCNNKYGLQYDLSGLNWGQFIDSEMMMENQDSIWFNIEQVLANVIRPIKPKLEPQPNKLWFTTKKKKRIAEAEKNLLNNQYELEDYEVGQRNLTALDLLEIPITELYPVVFFFLKIGERYTNSFITTLQEEYLIPS